MSETIEARRIETEPLTRRVFTRICAFPARLRPQGRRLLPLAALGVVLLVWELAPALGLVKPIFTSSPSRIAQAGVWLFAHGFWRDIQISLTEFTLGFSLAVVVGIPLGLALGWYARLGATLDPFITALNATPRVALLPLLILWLGLGIESKIAIIFLGAIFPILVNAVAAVRTIDPTLARCARAFGANDRQVLLTLAAPTSVPFVLAGMRLAVGRALVGVVVGEMVASTGGVGAMMARAGATFQTDQVFVGVLLIAAFGYALTEILKRLEAHVEVWRPREHS